MKKYLTSTAVAIALLSGPALAFDFGNGGNSNANASANATAGAAAISSNRNTNTNVNRNTNVNSNRQAQGQLQGQAQGQMQSANNRNVINHEAAASSAVAGSVAASGECGVGLGLGGSEISGSISLGVTWQNVPCIVRKEAAQLYAMGYQEAAVIHLGTYHKRIGKTLERAGVIAKPAAPSTSSRSEPATTATKVAYTSCKMDAGTVRVGVKRGASDALKARAVADCRAALR